MSAVATERVHHSGRVQDLPLVTYQIEMLGRDDSDLMRAWQDLDEYTTSTRGLLAVLTEYWAHAEVHHAYRPFIGEYRITGPDGSATAYYEPEIPR